MLEDKMAQLTDKGYLERLKEQRDFLRADIEQYEKGQAHFAFKLAGTLRTIFHSTQVSTPILPDLAERYGLQMSFKGHQERHFDDSTVLYVGFQVGNLSPDFSAPFLVTVDFEVKSPRDDIVRGVGQCFPKDHDEADFSRLAQSILQCIGTLSQETFPKGRS